VFAADTSKESNHTPHEEGALFLFNSKLKKKTDEFKKAFFLTLHHSAYDTC
jgi:hypothetical protein